MSQPLAEVKSNVKSRVDFSAKMGYEGGMAAKITWKTTYSAVKWRGGDTPRSSTGTFRVIKFGGFAGGELFLHESTKGWLIPMSAVNGLTITDAPGGIL